MTIEADIKQKALDVGFDAVGITTAEPIESAQAEYFRRWIEGGNAAKMAYLHRNIQKRFDPGQLLPQAKSVICVALNYRPKPEELVRNPSVRIARFALYEDYHPFIKKRLFELADFIGNSGCTAVQAAARRTRIQFKVCVDSAPLAERALAQRAGLGFIGKNHMLIHPELGNQILLGELITTLELKPDSPPEKQSCGDCGRCIRACPTGALASDGTFDARKCISFQTIEAPAAAPQPTLPDGSSANGCAPHYIFGCDECLLACPYEAAAPLRKNPDFHIHPEWQNLTAKQIRSMQQEEFAQIFAGSGFIRLGLNRLKQNIGI
ncbi:MAG: tRNA epoxyqueuosine(34) reductase QueG [Phycisphaerae bacterium]|nr:tRNA epoxyqueuosine(34) reductase QueG [Phycisphaerae bacterium]